MIYPIEYKTIPTQYAFLVEKTKTGVKVSIQLVRKLPPDLEFKTEKHARKFINELKEII